MQSPVSTSLAQPQLPPKPHVPFLNLPAPHCTCGPPFSWQVEPSHATQILSGSAVVALHNSHVPLHGPMASASWQIESPEASQVFGSSRVMHLWLGWSVPVPRLNNAQSMTAHVIINLLKLFDNLSITISSSIIEETRARYASWNVTLLFNGRCHADGCLRPLVILRINTNFARIWSGMQIYGT